MLLQVLNLNRECASKLKEEKEQCMAARASVGNFDHVI